MDCDELSSPSVKAIILGIIFGYLILIAFKLSTAASKVSNNLVAPDGLALSTS